MTIVEIRKYWITYYLCDMEIVINWRENRSLYRFTSQFYVILLVLWIRVTGITCSFIRFRIKDVRLRLGLGSRECYVRVRVSRSLGWGSYSKVRLGSVRTNGNVECKKQEHITTSINFQVFPTFPSNLTVRSGWLHHTAWKITIRCFLHAQYSRCFIFNANYK